MRTAVPAINTSPPHPPSRRAAAALRSQQTADCGEFLTPLCILFTYQTALVLKVERGICAARAVDSCGHQRFTWNTFRHFTHFETLVFPLETTAMLPHSFIIWKKKNLQIFIVQHFRTIYTILYYIYYICVYICTVYIVCIYTVYLCSLQLTLILFREPETRGVGQTPG